MLVLNANGLPDENFRFACRDYAYLMDRHYPERGALKLAGDRYRLSRDQRTVLYRGISPADVSARRKLRITTKVEGLTLGIDGYNVLFTLLSYRLGRLTFLATDGILRDAGAIHGRLKDENLLLECMDLLADYLSNAKPSRAEVFFDAPVSHSERHAGMLAEMLQRAGVTGSCHVIPSADYGLRHGTFDLVATSDTGIIDGSNAKVLDIPRVILLMVYGAGWLDISGLTD
jgi:hypothetical protein